MIINPNPDGISEQLADSHEKAAMLGTVDAWLNHLRAVLAANLAMLMVGFNDARTGLFGIDNVGVGIVHDRDGRGGMTVYPVDGIGMPIHGLNVRVTVSAGPCDCSEETVKDTATGRHVSKQEFSFPEFMEFLKSLSDPPSSQN